MATKRQLLLIELLFTAECENKRSHDEFLDVGINYKIGWERESAGTAWHHRWGEPPPHLDHVYNKIRPGEVSIGICHRNR